MFKIRSIIAIVCIFIFCFSKAVQAGALAADKTLNYDLALFSDTGKHSIKDIIMPSASYLKADTAGIDNPIKINLLQRGKDGLIVLDKSWIPLDENTTFRDTMFFDPALLPVVFNGKVLPDNLDFRSKKYNNINKEPEYNLISPDSTFTPLINKANKIQRMRQYYYLNPENIAKIKYSEQEFSQMSPIPNSVITAERKPFQDLISADNPMKIKVPTIERRKTKRLRWLIKGEHSLQVSQNHISDNWYKGGSSNYNIKSYQKLLLNYKRDKISFDNTIEWKLSLQNSSADTLRDISINEDLFRTYSVFGYQAFNKWSYSTTLEIKTQLFDAYPENSKDRRSSFLSPLDVNGGIGMSYNLENKFKNKPGKNLKFSLNLAPLSINFRYILDDKVDETKYKLDKGRDSKTDLGSLINSNLTFNINNFITWNSRFKYFTDYESITSEFENKFDFALNRYFSTSIFLYLRYDENSKKDDKLKYLQINEILSFGLNYKW